MSCTFYLRDRKITNEIIKQLDLLEKEFNTKLDNLYKELNDKVKNILPINNEDVMEDCRQDEPSYRINIFCKCLIFTPNYSINILNGIQETFEALGHFCIVAYHRKKKEKIFKTMMLANLLDITHYLLLDAYSGCITKVIARCQISERESTYWWNGKIEKPHEYHLEMRTKESLFEEIEKAL